MNTQVSPRLTLLASITLFAGAASAQTSPAARALLAARYLPAVEAAARRTVVPLRACYELLPSDAWRRIRQLTLHVDATGAVTDVTLTPPTEPMRSFRTCLLPIVRIWRFAAPPSRRAITVSYPREIVRTAFDRVAGSTPRS